MRTKLQSDAKETPIRCERNSNPMRIGLKFSPNEITYIIDILIILTTHSLIHIHKKSKKINGEYYLC